MIPYAQFKENLRKLEEEIAQACLEVGRSVAGVKILPVTKRHSVEAVEYADKSGLHAVGENTVQEAQKKQEACPVKITWELIGHLQSNKAALAVEVFDRIQSVDSTKLLTRIDHAAMVLHKEMRVLLQINAANDPSKFGIPMGQAAGLLECALNLKHIKVEGLMTIGELSSNKLIAQEAFNHLRELRDSLEVKMGVSLPELSMGMSGDIIEAVKAGSTIVRVGTGLYGERE